jgi:hypothetical protein
MGGNEQSPGGNEGSPRGNDVHTAADIVGTRPDDDSIERSAGGARRRSSERVEECMTFILADAETAGFFRSVKGGAYIDLGGVPRGDESSRVEGSDVPETDSGGGAGTPNSRGCVWGRFSELRWGQGTRGKAKLTLGKRGPWPGRNTERRGPWQGWW